MSFHVGQKVVCVDDDFSNCGRLPLNLPRKGGIYTLRDPFSADGWTWWRLVEVVNAPANPLNGQYGVQEPGFVPRRFRPIVERKTDISIFTAMLTPSKQGVDA